MKCPKCQSEYQAGDRFCRECGAKLPSLCPNCGHEVSPKDKFCPECGEKLAGISAVAQEKTIPKLEDMHAQLQSMIPDELAQKYMTAEQQATGENRPITALFADISGFTPLSATKSSEYMFQLVQDCFKALVGIVARYEGSISGFRGDGLLALFGAPILHENDAERAILAGIDMRSMMHDKGLQVSIGINTAMMTVGEIQTELHKEYTAYGTDVNLAARLQQSAEGGQILVGAGTYRLTRRAFDFETVSDLMLKGFPQPVTAYSVQHVKLHPEKLRGIEGLRARMIGREREFADLKELADNLMDGKGSIATIIGEAGIGKSRLVSELKSYLSEIIVTDETIPSSSFIPHPSSFLEGRCVSIGQSISYWAFLDMLRTYLNLTDTDTEPQIAEKIRKSMTDLFPQRQDDYLPFMGNLLSVKFGDELDNRLRYFTAEQIRHQTLMRLKDIFVAISHTRPLLLILEDLHWADDLSLDLIALLMDELTANPIMLLCIYRPEQEHRCWQLGGMAFRKCPDRYTEISLKKLSQTQSRQLVESLLEIDNLPESTKGMILAKSEGNPFFIEELIRSLIDMGLIYHEEYRWKARKEIEGIDVPDTIQSVLLSRVDRLNAETKYVLQCASVIGRLFKYRLLDHLARHERDLDTHLTELESKELINAERTVPELEYAFKHALTQEATYQSILERKRQEFHHQVGDGIETLYQQKLEEYYGELAYHYTRSADKEKAVEYLIKAGDKCKQLYANQDAIRYFDEALSLLDKLDETNEHKIQRLKALESLGDVHQTIGKHNDAIACFEKAVELATKQRIATARLAELYSKMGSAYFFLDQYDKMIETGKSGLAVLGEDILCPQGALVFDNIREGYEYKGDREKAEEYASKNAAIVRDLGYFDGIDKVYTGIAFTNGFLKNDPRYSISWTQECMEICERHNDKKGIALCCHWLGDTFHFSMGSREALYWYRRSISIAEDIGYTDIMMWSHVDIGGMLFKWKEELGEAEEHLKIGADMASRMKNDYYTALACAWLGELYLFKQDWDKSIDYKVTMAEIICRGKVRPTGAVVPILRLSTTILLVKFLCNLEEACKKTGRKAEFFSLCGKLKEWIKEITQDFRLTQWYLEPKEISGQFTQTIFLDDFDGSDLCPEWQCIDPKGGCSYELDNESSWLVIQVDSGCDLYPESNFDALRLLQDISGDFAIETKIAPAEEMPTVGGLLVWKDRDSYIRFERGMHGTNEIGLSGSINGKWCPFGRGMLVSDNIYMRIERIGDILSSYCSRDGANWLTCGEVNFPVDDPVQIGIHAIGGVGSRGGNMATATRFDYFRVQK